MDNLRTFFIFGLLIVSLLLWEAWQKDYVHPQQQVAQSASESTVASDLPNVVAEGKQDDLPDMPVAQSLEHLPVLDASHEVTSTAKIHVKTDVVDVMIDTKGGDIHGLNLLTYPVESTKSNEPVQLLSDNASHYFVVQSGLRSDSLAPTHYDQYQAEKNDYQLADGEDTLTVPLHWQTENGLKVTKIYHFHRDSYLIDVDYQIENKSGARFSAYPYAQFNRTKPGKKKGFVYTFTGAVFSSKSDQYEKVKFGALDDAAFSKTVASGWAAMTEHYFVAALIPADNEQKKTLYGKSINKHNYTAGIKMPTIVVDDGDTVNKTYKMYIGPEEPARLQAAAPNLDLTIDYGKFTIISQPLFTIMTWIHKLTNNWGWTIVFMVVLIKLAFYKLSAASYRSMASMRKLTPKLATLKERYGDDKQKFNQEMMSLYRTEKINPLGGCLPILVQMPVFLSFYWVLVESIEFRQAPFIFWLQDLTAMDPYFILPVLFGLSMFFQQRLNPAPQDPAQAMVMKAFPIIFSVFFAFFPSGLVLYWVVNNTLSIAQQWHITRKLGAL